MNQLLENSPGLREAGYCEHGFLTCKECTIWPPEKEEGSKKKKKKAETPRKPQEEVLSSRETTERKELGGGRNATEFISFRGDGAGVFKSKDGEAYLGRKAEFGTYYKRERAAYLVDLFLGFNLVPPTTIREIDGNVGSVQEFIPDAKSGDSYIQELTWFAPGDERKKASEESLAVLRLFDILIANSDRHGENFLVKDGQVIAIDHGLSFDERDRLNFFSHYKYHYYPDKELPKRIIRKVNKLRESKEMRVLLGSLLSEILHEMDVICFFRRLDYFGKILDRKGLIDSDDIDRYPGFKNRP